jgi:hypothetical protein
MVVLFENSKKRRARALPPGRPNDYEEQICFSDVCRWLRKAIDAADASGVCVTFSVSVHQAGADCDHETSP